MNHLMSNHVKSFQFTGSHLPELGFYFILNYSTTLILFCLTQETSGVSDTFTRGAQTALQVNNVACKHLHVFLKHLHGYPSHIQIPKRKKTPKNKTKKKQTNETGTL